MAGMSDDTYYRREVVTPALGWLGDELCRRTGRPRTAVGTKGDLNHKRGAHRSQEFCLRSPFSTSKTYTVQAGLTAEQFRHIAGFDFTPGATEAMIAQSRRLLGAMKAGQMEEVREIYCNVDGDKVVDGWDNVRNKAATSDSSHLWHWHLSLDRRHCDNRPLMERILAIALGDNLEDDMTPDESRMLRNLDRVGSALIGGAEEVTRFEWPAGKFADYPLEIAVQARTAAADAANAATQATQAQTHAQAAKAAADRAATAAEQTRTAVEVLAAKPTATIDRAMLIGAIREVLAEGVLPAATPSS